MKRQAGDPYVARAAADGYRARAAYKLIEINEKFDFLRNGQVVVDLGAAPGSWSQYIARAFPKSKIFAMDLLDIKPIPGVEFYQGDFTADEALRWLCQKLSERRAQVSPLHGRSKSADVDDNEPPALCAQRSSLCREAASADVVLSDMAPNTVGHKRTDHLRQMVLLEYALDFALRALKPGGTFVAKSFTGGETGELIREMKMHFAAVHQIKPPSSRKESVEMFIVAQGFKESINEE